MQDKENTQNCENILCIMVTNYLDDPHAEYTFIKPIICG